MAHAITMATNPTSDLSAISLLSFSLFISLSLFSFSFSLPHSLGARCTRAVRPSVRTSVRPSPPSRARTYVILLFCRRLSTSVSLSVPSDGSIENACIALSLIGNWRDHTTMLASMMKCYTRLSRVNLSTRYSFAWSNDPYRYGNKLMRDIACSVSIRVKQNRILLWSTSDSQTRI